MTKSHGSLEMPRGWQPQIRIELATQYGMALDSIPPNSLEGIKQSMAELGHFTGALPNYNDPNNYPSRNAKRNQ